jgi:hypothetical protein
VGSEEPTHPDMAHFMKQDRDENAKYPQEQDMQAEPNQVKVEKRDNQPEEWMDVHGGAEQSKSQIEGRFLGSIEQHGRSFSMEMRSLSCQESPWATPAFRL